MESGLEILLISSGGSIILNGTSNLQQGVLIENSLNSGSGDINITAASTSNTALDINNPITGNGTITFTADTNIITNNIIGTGDFILQPLDPTIDLTLGGSGDNAINFSQ